MIDAKTVVVLIGFGWLLVDLLWFPMPSEASVYQLLREPADDTDTETRGLQTRVRSPLKKVVAYGLPTALGVTLFLIPLAAAFWRPAIDYLIPISRLDSVWSFRLGAVLMLGGRVVTFVSTLQLRRHTTRDELQCSGFFRWSRNPGLVGMYAFYLGLCFLFPCVVLFVGLVPYVWNMHTRVLMEESHLGSLMGAPYANYMARVPRYVPFPSVRDDRRGTTTSAGAKQKRE